MRAVIDTVIKAFLKTAQSLSSFVKFINHHVFQNGTVKFQKNISSSTCF